MFFLGELKKFYLVESAGAKTLPEIVKNKKQYRDMADNYNSK